MTSGDVNSNQPSNIPIVGDVCNPRARPVRIVHISDTRGLHVDIVNKIPKGDILIHSGDFNKYHFIDRFANDRERQIQLHRMNFFFQSLSHEYKIFISGNEDLCLSCLSPDIIQQYLPNVIYLQDKACHLKGIQFYGMPWTLKTFSTLFTKPSAFTRNFNSLNRKWHDIPDNVDVLITHMPPPAWTVEDKIYDQLVQRIKPNVHLFSDDCESIGFKWKNNIFFSNGSLLGRHACKIGSVKTCPNTCWQYPYRLWESDSPHLRAEHYKCINKKSRYQSKSEPLPANVVDYYIQIKEDEFNNVILPEY